VERGIFVKRTQCLLFVLIFLVSAIGLAGCGGKSEPPKQEVKTITMKFGHYAPASHPGQQAAKMFAEAVEKRTNGAIKITVFPDNQLGAPPELLEQNIMGAIDMSLPTQGALDKYSKKFAVVMLPFVFKDAQHAYKVLDGPFMKWAAPDLEGQGLVFLANWEWGFRNLTNNVRPINSPDDVKGLKIRTPPEIQLQAAMEALGGNVTKIAFPELFMALKQGVVDAQENPLSIIFHNKYYEAQKHLALTNHVYNSMVHVMSKKTWDKLTPDQQKIIREESVKAGNWMREQVQKEEANLVKQLEEKGMQVTRPNVADFKARMQPAYDRIGQYAGKDNVDAFLKMADSTK
jgi:tripartite ATP-independent transporter DctP family solute receptor